MSRTVGIAIFLAVAGIIGFASYHFGSSQMLEAEANDAKKSAEAAAVKKNPLHSIQDDEAVIGDPKAAITIIEYASLSCPHCKAFHEKVLPELKSKYIDKGIAKMTFRNFPLNEPALRAAMLVECVGKERAPKFIDVLFELQDKWAFESDFVANIQKIAAVGGVSQEQFSTCMTNTSLEEKIIKARKDATDQLNLQGTPSFFVNDVEISGKVTMDSFDRVIKDLQDK